MVVRVIGYSGSREGMTEKQKLAVSRLLFRFKPRLGVHGACVGGDAEFDEMCKYKIIPRRCYPANNVPGHFVMDYRAAEVEDVRRPSPAPARTGNVISDSDIMICCPKEEHEPDDLRWHGTWWAVRHTREAHKPLFLVKPSGFVQEERTQEVYYTPQRRRMLKE